MARVNEFTDGVFSKFYGGTQVIPAFDAFLEKNNPENPSNNLRKFSKSYKDYVTKERNQLERISLIEEIIMQLRAKEKLEDVKVSFVREYIYARAPFYRRDKTSKDVRVIVDNKEFWKLNLKKLLMNEEFMQKAKEKLTKQMDILIAKNMKRLSEIDEVIRKQEEKLRNELKEAIRKEIAKEAKVEEAPAKPVKKASKPKATKQKETVTQEAEPAVAE